MDGQVLIPPDLVPPPLRGLLFLPLYCEQFHDTLMTAPHDLWLKVFITCEMLFQLPFFVVATRAILRSEKEAPPSWFRSACLVYGSHTSTTLFPILATILLNEENTLTEKATLFGFYFPYLLFPAWLVYICVVNEDIFTDPDKKSTKTS